MDHLQGPMDRLGTNLSQRALGEVLAQIEHLRFHFGSGPIETTFRATATTQTVLSRPHRRLRRARRPMLDRREADAKLTCDGAQGEAARQSLQQGKSAARSQVFISGV